MIKYYLCLCIAILMGSTFCKASNDKNNLVVTSKSLASKEFDLNKIKELAFINNNMLVFMTDGLYESLNIKDIQKITFDVVINGSLEKVEDCVGADLSISVYNKILTLTELNGNEIEVMLYGMNGEPIMNTKGKGTIQIDFNTLSPGIYIIRANDKSIKYIN